MKEMTPEEAEALDEYSIWFAILPVFGLQYRRYLVCNTGSIWFAILAVFGLQYRRY